MAPSPKALLASHAVFFLAGVVIGKQIDAEELTNYRNVHETATSRWYRRSFNATLGIASIGMFMFGIRALARQPSSSTESS
mmetsp:Transcript_26101/g.47344  ORF Transcript_26101/g.47344 Transcript_26101/m.47344 type:complete len:81 (+) Transcript_26101:108-350(+)